VVVDGRMHVVVADLDTAGTGALAGPVLLKVLAVDSPATALVDRAELLMSPGAPAGACVSLVRMALGES